MNAARKKLLKRTHTIQVIKNVIEAILVMAGFLLAMSEPLKGVR